MPTYEVTPRFNTDLDLRPPLRRRRLSGSGTHSVKERAGSASVRRNKARDQHDRRPRKSVKPNSRELAQCVPETEG
jgi:hypothetical protein